MPAPDYGILKKQWQDTGALENPFVGEYADYDPMQGKVVAPGSAKLGQEDWMYQIKQAPVNKAPASPTVTPPPTVTPTPTTTPTAPATPAPPASPIETAQNDAVKALQDQAVFAQNQYDKLNKEFENYTKDIEAIDAENNPLLQSIKDTFNKRIEQMGVINNSMSKQVDISGVKSGLSRYASQIQQGFVSNEIKNGMNRISELESQKLAAVEQAKQALKSQAKDKWKTFSEFMDSASKAYNDKKQAVLDLHTLLKTEEDDLQKKQLLDLQTQQAELDLQKTKQEIMQTNLDSYATSLLDFDTVTGEVSMPTDADIQTLSEQMGVSSAQLKNTLTTKAYELSKMSQEDRKRELDILSAQQQFIPQAFQEFEYAKQNANFTGDFFDYLASKEEAQIGKKIIGTEKTGYYEYDSTIKDWKQIIPPVYNNELSPQIISQIDKIRSEFEGAPITKTYNEVLNKKLSVDQMVSLKEAGPVDLALVFEFMKALDPSSVVRESEYDVAAKSGAIFEGAFKKFNGQFKDGQFLTTDVKNQFKNLIDIKFDTINQQYQNYYNEKARLIDKKTGESDGNSYLPDFSGVLNKDVSTILDDYYLKNEDKQKYIDKLMGQYSDDEILEILNVSFNKPLSLGINSSEVKGIKDGSKVTTALGKGVATGIQAGSSAWAPGFDFYLDGGKGATVKAPLSGVVTYVGNYAGFGNQVRIQLADGSEMWLSHLDATDVKKGQVVQAGTAIGKQGNTGNVLSSQGTKLSTAQIASGKGTHVDITIKKPGKEANLKQPQNFLTSQQVASLLSTKLI
jgi:hypothetical protein